MLYKTLFTITLASLASANLVPRQSSNTTMPSCGQTCSMTTAYPSSCSSATDYACNCKYNDWIGVEAQCLVQACGNQLNSTDVQQALAAATALCQAAAGVNIDFAGNATTIISQQSNGTNSMSGTPTSTAPAGQNTGNSGNKKGNGAGAVAVQGGALVGGVLAVAAALFM